MSELEDLPIRLRFAPSPTGEVHLGSARTALFDFLFARHNRGTHILRIEDTDRARYVPGAMDRFFADLAWLGIEFDEGPQAGGRYGPYISSQRAHLYRQAADQLLRQGQAYRCWCSSSRLEQMREAQAKAHQSPRYDRHCLHLTDQERSAKDQAGDPFVIRMQIPAGQTSFIDLIRGEITIDNKELDDQVLMKSDGLPTYHLAAVVDDHAMEISHVFRSEEWIPSTPKHILLYEMFGWTPPRFAHLPLILNRERRKLSKRKDGPGVWISTYRQQGYLPEALVNYLAFMGWNPGDEREFFSLDELIKEFSIERVHSAGAIFDPVKLKSMNGSYLRRLSASQILARLQAGQFLPSGLESRPTDEVERFVEISRERMEILSDFSALVEPLLELQDYPAERLIFRKSDRDRTARGLVAAIGRLTAASVQDWQSVAALQSILADFDQSALTNGDVFWPVRVALSGLEASPAPAELLWALGKETSLARLVQARQKILA